MQSSLGRGFTIGYWGNSGRVVLRRVTYGDERCAGSQNSPVVQSGGSITTNRDGRQMAKHRARSAPRWAWPALALLALVGLVLAGVLIVAARSGETDAVAGASCDRPVRVVAASSYAPVLAALTAARQPDDCLRVEVTAADGRAAAKRAGDVNADVWIADDSSWAGSAGGVSLAQAPAAGAGTVLATSPIYMVTAPATGARLQKAGAGWLGLARLVGEKAARLVVRDPGGSGDGLVGAGAAAEAVWLDKDMDA